jgi:hypothetical protein
VAAASRLASFSLNQLEVSPGLVFMARDSKFRPSNLSGVAALFRARATLVAKRLPEYDQSSTKTPTKSTKADLCPPAHNGLVAGSSPAGPTKEIRSLFGFVRNHRARNTPLRLRLPCFGNSQTNVALRTGLGPSHFNRRFGGIIVRNGGTKSHPFSPTSR